MLRTRTPCRRCASALYVCTRPGNPTSRLACGSKWTSQAGSSFTRSNLSASAVTVDSSAFTTSIGACVRSPAKLNQSCGYSSNKCLKVASYGFDMPDSLGTELQHRAGGRGHDTSIQDE